jgi:hypothetical protein
MSKDRAYAESFKLRLADKLQTLLDEFAEGKISREQFHLLYARYTARMDLVDSALAGGDMDALTITETGLSTLAIKEVTSGKIVGLRLYYNGDGRVIETLGQFNAPNEKVARDLQHYLQAEAQKSEARIEKSSEIGWLLFAGRHFTTVVGQFEHEPSKQQIREIERLHRDFETANRASFLRGEIEPTKLAYPFIVLVQQKLKKLP